MTLDATVPYRTAANYTMTVIPMFVLMAQAVSASGLVGEDYFKNPYTCGKPMRGIDLEIWIDWMMKGSYILLIEKKDRCGNSLSKRG